MKLSSGDRPWKVVAAIVAVSAFVASVVIVFRPHVGANRQRAPQIPTTSITQPDGLSCEVYVPQNLDRSAPHTLLFATSPGGNARELLPVWKDACDKFQWILVASNNFRNGPTSDKDLALELETLTLMKRTYRIDRIYAAGFSGAGMHAHDLIADHPDIFRGIVVNTGMMPHHFPNNAAFDPTHYPHDKIAVFLASPNDFRYREMGEDRKLLEGIGWKIRWLEFPAGHTYAPPSLYVEAAAWLTQTGG